MTRRRGLFRRESLRRTFTPGPRPMSRAGQSPARSGEDRARSRLLRRYSRRDGKCEWSFARATAERSTAEVIAEGMAPRSGADHARDGGFGWAQAWSRSTNADRGGNLARRRIGSSKRVCPCVKSLRQKSEIPVSAPRIRSRTYRSRGRGQGLAEREHLTRTSG